MALHQNYAGFCPLSGLVEGNLQIIITDMGSLSLGLTHFKHN